MEVKTAGNGKIAFVFNKHDLLAIKTGKILNASLVSGTEKLHCAFIRDHVYEQEVRKFQKETQQAAAAALLKAQQSPEIAETESPTEQKQPVEQTTNP